MESVSGARFEFGNEVQVEVAGLIRLGMDEQTATANVVAEAHEARDHIREQSRAEAVAFVGSIDTESCEQCHGLGIAASTFTNSGWGCFEVELRHAPSVISNNDAAALCRDDEHAGGAGGRGLVGVIAQPVGLFGRRTREGLDFVVGHEKPWCAVAAGHSTNGEGRCMS